MKDEIKEILDNLNKEYESIKDYANYPDDVLSCEDLIKLLDYITNLQEKLEVSQTNEETYRLEMLDITKCLGLDEDTIFDEAKEKVTNLQEELEEQKRIEQKDLETIQSLEEKINQYENPDDLTLFYMWLDEKAKDKMKQLEEEIKKILHKLRSDDYYKKEYQKSIYYERDLKKLEDYITNLQEENEKLKEENKRIFSKVNDDELLISNAMNYAEAQEYKSRNEKAIECIKEHWVIDEPVKFKNDLLDILQGSDKDE